MLLIIGLVGLAGHRRSIRLDFAYAAATTYIVIVGIVYNTLLTGLPGGIDVPWANTVLHVMIAVAIAAVGWLVLWDSLVKVLKP